MMRARSLVVALALVVVVGTGFAAEQAQHIGSYGALQLYLEAVSLVHDQYADPISWDRLAHLGISGLVGALDSDSQVLTPEQHRELTAAGPADAQIGVALTRRDHALAVIVAIDGTPAAAAGVEAGDEILTIDGTSSAEMQPIDAAERLRGQPGTAVVLGIARKGWPEPRSITVTRARAPASTVSARDLAPRIVYVRLSGLEDATVEELGDVLGGPRAKGARGLILDLRNNPGKSAEAAVKIASMFLERASVVAVVESRTHAQLDELLTSAEPAFGRVPIAVLVNRGTASAAEILAGALHDSGRAVTVGTTTFGNASAQSLIPLSDGSALWLTTARYLTPRHRVIDGTGVVPDFVVDRPGGMPSATAAEPGTDPQLALAADIVRAASIIDVSRQPVRASGPATTLSQAVRGRSPGAQDSRSPLHPSDHTAPGGSGLPVQNGDVLPIRAR